MELREYFENHCEETVAEFAKKCNIHPSCIYRWILGQSRPTVNKARVVAKMTNNKVTFEEIRKIGKK